MSLILVKFIHRVVSEWPRSGIELPGQLKIPSRANLPLKAIRMCSRHRYWTFSSSEEFFLGVCQSESWKLRYVGERLIESVIIILRSEPCWQKVWHWHTLLGALNYGNKLSKLLVGNLKLLLGMSKTQTLIKLTLSASKTLRAPS